MKSCIIIKDFIIIIKDLSVFRILVKTQLYCSKKEALDSDTNTLGTLEEIFDFWVKNLICTTLQKNCNEPQSHSLG